MAGSIRQRGKQSWEVRAFAGKDPATGKKQYVTKTVRGERREAEIALGRLLGEIDDGQHAVRAGTVGDLCERWFAHAAPDLSPSVVPEYRRLLDNRILPRWGTTPLRRLRTADLDLWYAELRRSGGLKGGGPLAPNSVTRIHAVLRRALAQGVKWGWITINPAANASPPRARKQQLELPDPGDVARLIEASANVNPSLPTYLRLAAATAARRGEMCALRWKHVDFKRRRLTISRGIVEAGGRLVEKDTKTHQVRTVTLDEDTTAILLAHRDRCVELVGKCGASLVPEAFLFSHEVDFFQAVATELRHPRIRPLARRARPRRRQAPPPPPFQRHLLPQECRRDPGRPPGDAAPRAACPGPGHSRPRRTWRPRRPTPPDSAAAPQRARRRARAPWPCRSRVRSL